MTEATDRSADRIPSYAFTTAAVEAENQFEAWVSTIGPLATMKQRSPHKTRFLAQSLEKRLPFPQKGSFKRPAVPSLGEFVMSVR